MGGVGFVDIYTIMIGRLQGNLQIVPRFNDSFRNDQKTELWPESVNPFEKDLKAEIGYGGNKEAARKVGEAVAKRALEKGIEEVAFDRGGFLYHGRVKELAEGAREGGLKF